MNRLDPADRSELHDVVYSLVDELVPPLELLGQALRELAMPPVDPYIAAAAAIARTLVDTKYHLTFWLEPDGSLSGGLSLVGEDATLPGLFAQGNTPAGGSLDVLFVALLREAIAWGSARVAGGDLT